MKWPWKCGDHLIKHHEVVPSTQQNHDTFPVQCGDENTSHYNTCPVQSLIFSYFKTSCLPLSVIVSSKIMDAICLVAFLLHKSRHTTPSYHGSIGACLHTPMTTLQSTFHDIGRNKNFTIIIKGGKYQIKTILYPNVSP